jgi:hypothetical protein
MLVPIGQQLRRGNFATIGFHRSRFLFHEVSNLTAAGTVSNQADKELNYVKVRLNFGLDKPSQDDL